MDLPAIPVTQFQLFLLCLARVLALVGAIPVFSSRQAPVPVKIGLGFTTALLLFPLMAPHIPHIPFSMGHYGLMLLNEIILGLLLGLIARLVFTAVSFGGTIIGYQMGFAAANIFDPQTSQQLSLMSQFQNVLAILIFLALDIHHLFFEALVQSYTLLPPGTLHLGSSSTELLMHLASRMFLLGVKFSAPVLALLLISNLVLGVLARVFPQLNVFMLSFPLNIGISLLVIGLTLTATLSILRHEFDAMGADMLQMIRLLGRQ